MSTDGTLDELYKSQLKGMQKDIDKISTRNEPDDLKFAKEHPDKHYRREELDRQIQAKFTLIHSEYKTGLTGIEKNDSELFARKNGEWKQYCHKIVQRQKLTTPNPFAFQNKVWNAAKALNENPTEKASEILDEKATPEHLEL